MNVNIKEKLSEIFHLSFINEKIQEGYHLPNKCPNYEKKDDEEENIKNDIIHCNKCMVKLIDYEKLTESQKNSYRKKAEYLYELLKKNNLDIISIK